MCADGRYQSKVSHSKDKNYVEMMIKFIELLSLFIIRLRSRMYTMIGIEELLRKAYFRSALD